MTIIQLEYLLAVASCGNFSTAAKQCFVTQPSLSMQIKALEEELGVQLLDRTHKPVRPTEAGEVVIQKTKEAIAAYQGIKESIEELKGETSGRLRLGVIPTISPYLAHKFIPTFAKKYPHVELEVHDMTTNDIIAAMSRDSIDAAIVAGGTCGDGVIEYELFTDKFHAYVSPQHPLYQRTNIKIEDIDVKDLVMLSSGNCMRDQVIDLCKAKFDNPSSYTFVSGSIETMMRIVDCTQLLTIIPEMAIEYLPRFKEKSIKPLENGSASRKIAVVARRTYVKNSIIKALTETICQCVGVK